MRRKRDEGAGASGPGGRITPTDVQRVEFRLAFRGYNERDVDAFLDRVTEDLAAYIEENERLRSAGAGGPAVGASDAAEARSEADRIVAEAREEAARIVREAEARAAAIAAPAGDARAAVAPFLTSERGFLQQLGGLVQGHAEEIKAMVLALRERAEGSGAPAEDAIPALARETSEPRATGGATEEAEPDAPATTAEEAFAPISVPEGEGAAQQEPEPDREPTRPAAARLRTDSGERSLRELFWGED